MTTNKSQDLLEKSIYLLL